MYTCSKTFFVIPKIKNKNFSENRTSNKNARTMIQKQNQLNIENNII